MLLFGKIINAETKEVALADINDKGHFPDCQEMEVEQAWNGSWYVKGYAPEKPEAITNAERVSELKALLASKDYWTSKRADGEYTEEEWAEKVAQRKAWREEINMLENKEIKE